MLKYFFKMRYTRSPPSIQTLNLICLCKLVDESIDATSWVLQVNFKVSLPPTRY